MNSLHKNTKEQSRNNTPKHVICCVDMIVDKALAFLYINLLLIYLYIVLVINKKNSSYLKTLFVPKKGQVNPEEGMGCTKNLIIELFLIVIEHFSALYNFCI